MKFLNRYNHKRPSSPCGKETMTQAQFLDDCDINKILSRYKVTGALPPERAEGVFIDCTAYGDFAENIQRITEAKQLFQDLPSTVRARFGNDPVAFYDFVMDDANTEECIKLGMKIQRKRERTAVDAIDELKNVVTAQAASPSTVGDGIAK